MRFVEQSRQTHQGWNGRSETGGTRKAKSPYVDAFRQADFSGCDKTHGGVSSWAKISMELFAFVSVNPDASYDTHSIPKRDHDTYNGIHLERKQIREQSSQATNETMKIKSKHIIRDGYWESQ